MTRHPCTKECKTSFFSTRVKHHPSCFHNPESGRLPEYARGYNDGYYVAKKEQQDKINALLKTVEILCDFINKLGLNK